MITVWHDSAEVKNLMNHPSLCVAESNSRRVHYWMKRLNMSLSVYEWRTKSFFIWCYYRCAPQTRKLTEGRKLEFIRQTRNWKKLQRPLLHNELSGNKIWTTATCYLFLNDSSKTIFNRNGTIDNLETWNRSQWMRYQLLQNRGTKFYLILKLIEKKIKYLRWDADRTWSFITILKKIQPSCTTGRHSDYLRVVKLLSSNIDCNFLRSSLALDWGKNLITLNEYL